MRSAMMARMRVRGTGSVGRLARSGGASGGNCVAAAFWTGGCRTGEVAARRTSSFVMRPSGPVPAMPLRSRPCSLAMRRARGEERRRPAGPCATCGAAAFWTGCCAGTCGAAAFWTGCRAGTCGAAACAFDAGAATFVPASPMMATTVLTSTVAPSGKRISASTPATGEGISASTLSVEISKSGSSFSTSSPTALSHLVIVPSKIDSPIWGMMTSVGIASSFADRRL